MFTAHTSPTSPTSPADHLTFAALTQPASASPTPQRPAPSHPTLWASDCLGAMLDEIGHAMLLVDGNRVLHANRIARHELASTPGGHGADEADTPSHMPHHPLHLLQGHIAAHQHADAVALHDAITQAQTRGTRKLLTVGRAGWSVCVAVIPVNGLKREAVALGAAAANVKNERAVLLMLGKRHMCDTLSVFWFARSHGLTQAEGSVLQSLCQGLAPQDIARDHHVAISTVRTQLAAIRAKTAAPNLRDLVNQVACLPPLVHALAGTRA
jgi:DNA-binding CsgD family transcriptional regulator